MDTILYCENRNKFYKGETKNAVTKWTTKNEDAKKFYIWEANETIDHLKRLIFDHKYIKAVGLDFKRYK
jgi:REP element-mobilizing transposase RayT